ncbi:platelet endothelial cell adhesion molecule [Chanos chanos]|uniref:Platelet endothelial cell adhesion molecule n=1 Tax=Chanos chanos TaxID=29144 RepID=A0A6J2VYY7_CHACN|nr:platelet endothelial cell adhesion molecule-like [Chanos chanos]
MAANLLFLFLLFINWTGAQQTFTIEEVKLTIEPEGELKSGSSVTLNCTSKVSRTAGFIPNYEYSLHKNKNLLKSGSDVFTIPHARVSDSGSYHCSLRIGTVTKESASETLKISGLQTPVLIVEKTEVLEGDMVSISCEAKGETGPFVFVFLDGHRDIDSFETDNDQVQTKQPLTKPGIVTLSCRYTVKLRASTETSEISNKVNITVNELPITPLITVSPSSNVIEGDPLEVVCKVEGNLTGTQYDVDLVLGEEIRSTGKGQISFKKIVTANDSGVHKCRIRTDKVFKWTAASVTVQELFSQPVLTIQPPVVFEKERVNLSCSSSKYSRERITAKDIKYYIYRGDDLLTLGSFNGRHTLLANSSTNGNYSCKAEAKNISKKSTAVTFKAKVLVSQPVIRMGEVILGQPFQIFCRSEKGSLPIKYTLLKDNNDVSVSTVYGLSENASFTAIIHDQHEIYQFRCRAENNGSSIAESSRLNGTVIVPVKKASLTVITPDVTEGQTMTLLCQASNSSTTPLTFKWYRSSTRELLRTVTVNKLFGTHTIQEVSRENRDSYYCVALNKAGSVKSDPVMVEVRLARWKKGLIVASCLLLLAISILCGIVYYKSKRGKRATAAELSVKPSSRKSDGSLTVSLAHDTAVYNAPKAGVDGGGKSIWSEKPSDSDSSEQSSTDTPSEADVEYTEVVHPQPVDPTRVPLRKGTDTVYSELQTSLHGAPERVSYVSDFSSFSVTFILFSALPLDPV